MALKDNLISVWELSEASGNALDSHGSNDLTETSGTIGAAAGPSGLDGARDIEAGDTEWFARTDNTDLSTGNIDFTLQAWVNLESKGANRTIIGKWFSTGSNLEYVLYFESSSDRFQFAVNYDGQAIGGHVHSQNATTFGSPSLATWYLIHAWHDSVNNLVGICVNAGTADTSSWSNGVHDGTAQFRVGADQEGNQFDGLIAQVALWKRVLTSDERTALYNSGNGLPYADWDAGGGGGTPVFNAAWCINTNKFQGIGRTP